MKLCDEYKKYKWKPMTNKFELDYRELLADIIKYGECAENRTDIKTQVLFNRNMNIDLRSGFPILTGKKIFFDKAYHEYVWFKEGMVTTKYLNDNGITWWNQYANKDGYIGKTYGYQLRNYNGEFDQLEYVINEIKLNSRRAHISLWNPEEIAAVILPVCYTGFTFVRINNVLNMQMQFRSSDVFLGLPYDIIVGALLLTEVAKFCDLEAGELGINISNAHVYKNHYSQSLEYLQNPIYDLPEYDSITNKLLNYKHGPFIGAKLNN